MIYHGRITHVVPDTNFVLHGRPLAEITTAMLGVSEPSEWLFVRTVIRELDHHTHSQTSRVKRRASSAIRELEAATSGQSKGRPMQTFVPRPPLEYAAMGFDPHVNDEKILAEISAYKSEDPAAIVLLLTLDTGMRLTAMLHGIDLVSTETNLRAVEEEDATERELRTTRQELEALKATQPEIMLSLKNGALEIEVPVFPVLSEQTLSKIIGDLSSPEPESGPYMTYISTIMISHFQRNPNYSQALEKYVERLREVVPALWTSLGSIVTLPLELHNKGDAEARDVNLEIRAPVVVTALKDILQKPAIPKKPPLYVEKQGAFFGMNLARDVQGFNRLLEPSRITARPYVPAKSSGPTILEDGRIGYWREAIRQRRTLSLNPLLLQLVRHVPAFDIRYEIRGSNVSGLQAGRLIVKPVVLSETDAVEEINNALGRPVT